MPGDNRCPAGGKGSLDCAVQVQEAVSTFLYGINIRLKLRSDVT